MDIRLKLDALIAQKKVQDKIDRIAHPGPALQRIGLYMVSSIKRNFQEEGRPVRWKPSQRAIDQHGKTLTDTGRLKKSINKKVVGNTVYVGTNVPYAPPHQFGAVLKKAAHFGYRVLKPGTKKTYTRKNVYLKAGTKIPARSFLLIQDGDKPRIRRILAEWIDGKSN